MIRRVLGLGAAISLAATMITGSASASVAAVSPPPVNAKFDYQIGAAYPPPSGVRVVDRDREQSPVSGLYNICYVNGYQTQPAEIDWWKANHDDLLLKDARGNYVIDSDWGEILLDIRTSAKRTALAAIVGAWIDGCRDHGFQAIEPDNLDSWTRSKNLLTQQNAIDFAKLLTARAHTAGVAIAQKNTAEIAENGRSYGFDFAIAEECGRYNECDSYTSGFGNNVIVIEYRRQDFTKACSGWGSRLSVVLRDRNVTAPGSSTYQYDAC